MLETIHVQCYRCKTVYEVEYELRGQLVECAVCNTIFVVPKLGEEHKDQILKTNPYVEENPAAGEDANLQTAVGVESTSGLPTKTKTIKLSKSSCGMIPQIEDKFGTSTGHHPLHGRRHQEDEDNILKDFSKTNVKFVREVPKSASKWWCFWRRKK